jgi:hypothetical protein
VIGDPVFVYRAVTTLFYAWACSTNLWVFYHGVRLNRRSHSMQTAWLYPLCVALSSGSACVARYLFVVNHLPFSFLDGVSFIVAPLMALTGIQAIKRIKQLEGGE